MDDVALVRRLLDAVMARDYDALPDILAPDHLFRGVLGWATEGVDAYADAIRNYYNVFPDMTMRVEHVFGGQGFVAVRWIHKGTHLGEGWPIPPTGRVVEYPIHKHCRISGGKIAEQWETWDRAAIREQVGFVFDTLAKPTA